MLKVLGKVVLLAGLAAGCAGRVWPEGAKDVPVAVLPDTVVPPAETRGAAELPQPNAPAPTPSDLAPLPLPEGVSADDFDISLGFNGRVSYWLSYYQKYGDTFATWLERMSRYEPFIRKELTAAGLPSDLIYLALIESGFSPNATSRARAVGIWQFMAETARDQGMEVSTYVDERRDPIRATEAAVRHLRWLYRGLGSWYLAAAAYNSGEGRVTRALDTLVAGARGADSLFWQIAPVLPGETRDYVPQFVAAAILAKYPERFGISTARLPGPDDFDVIRVDRPTDLAAIARAARTDEDAIRRLNAQYYLGVTPPGRTVSVRVPAGLAERARARLADMPRRERVHDLRYTASAGETPGTIAQRFDVSLTAFRKANHLSRKTRRLAPGRELVIPLAPAVSLARTEKSKSRNRSQDAAAARRAKRTAPASQSDTHASSDGRLATRDLPASSERARTGRRSAATDRSTARDDEQGSSRKSAARKSAYVVRPGDTLAEIARDHGVSIARLRVLNGLSTRSVLRPGQRLVVRGDARSRIARDRGVSGAAGP